MRSDLLYLEHVLECIRRIEEYTAGGKVEFLLSTFLQDGVIRNLQTLAESTKRLSPECRDSAPGIPWRQILGFRNLVVHDYLRIDLLQIWDIAASDLSAVRRTE